MNRTLARAIAAILVGSMWAGPVGAETKTAIGVKGGLNLALMTGDLTDALPPTAETTRQPIVRGVAGVFASFDFNDRWALTAEVLYTQKGSEWKTVDTQGAVVATTTQTVGVDYVEIPVLAEFTIPQSGRVQPFFYAGLAVAFPTASDMKVDARADSSGTKLRHDSYYSSNIYNTTSPLFEGAVGIGLDWKLGGNRMTFEARYTRSLGAVLDDVDVGQVPDDDTALAHYPSGEAFKLAHNVFSFIIGYAFSL
jgi:hypothetical protein